MSFRSLIEINHDAIQIGDGLLEALGLYVASANRENADRLKRFGVTVIGMRHHSGAFIVEGEPDGFPVQHLAAPPLQGDGQ